MKQDYINTLRKEFFKYKQAGNNEQAYKIKAIIARLLNTVIVTPNSKVKDIR